MTGPADPPGAAVRRFARPAIVDEVGAARLAVIEASAGTGKTHALERLVVDEILRGIPVDAILVLTFTEKATREMDRRIRTLLARIDSLDPGDDDVDPDDPDHPAWHLDEAARRRIRAARRGFDRASIATIHGFCQRVLGDEAFSSGHRLTATLVDGRRALLRAFREELRVILAPPSPTADVEPLRAPLLEVLGEQGDPGPIEDALLRWAAEPGRVVGEVADGELVDALARVPGPEAARRAWGTPLQRWLRRDVAARCLEALVGLAQVADVARQRDATPTATRARFDAWASSAIGQTAALDYLRAKLGGSAGSARSRPSALDGVARLVADPRLRRGSAWAALLPALVHRVRARADRSKAARGEVDFDDLIRLVRAAVAPAPDGTPSPLCQRLRARTRVALIDEFQDTDADQWGIFRDVFFHSPDGHRLRLIGDPKQAIYGFRSADVHTYLRARDEVLSAGGTRVVLGTSYRATPAVVAATNRLFAEGFFTGAMDFAPVTAGRRGLSAVDGDGRPTPPVLLLRPMPSEPLDARRLGHVLADGIADEIVRALADGGGGLRLREPDVPDRSLRARDIQVLTRTTDEGATVGGALAARGVPHVFVRQEGLFQTPEARALRDVLVALEHPGAEGLRLRAMRTDWFGVPLAALPRARALPGDHPLLERFEALRRAAHAGDFPTLFRRLTGEGGLTTRGLAAGSAGTRALTNHGHLAEVLLAEAQSGRLGLGELRQRLDDLIAGRAAPLGADGEQERASDPDGDAVQVITMHKAKGLEATLVFLFGGFFGTNPDRWSPAVYRDAEGRRAAWIGGDQPPEVAARVQAEARQEDERLLYVAVTRARGQVVLPYLGPLPGELAGGAPAPSVLGRTPTGAYRVLAARLEALVGAGDVGRADDGAITWGSTGRLAGVRVWPVDAGDAAQPTAPSTAALEDVSPETASPATRAARVADILDRLDQDEAAATTVSERSRLVAERSGFAVVSYSGLKEAAARHGTVWQHPETALREPFAGEVVDAPPDWAPAGAGAAGAEREPDPPLDPAGDDELPGGTAVGLFLHDVLEHADPSPAIDAPNAEAWLRRPGVAELFLGAAQRNGVDPRVIPAAARCAFAGLRAPLDLPRSGSELDAALPNGVAGADAWVREMRLLYPEPGASPASGRPPDLVRGIVDVVFEVGGRLYFLDWKSDRLPGYDRSTVRAHVDAHYRLQVDLYTLGLLRLLRLETGDEESARGRFGGSIYAFLRGMRPDDGQAGVCFERPHDEALTALEARVEKTLAAARSAR